MTSLHNKLTQPPALRRVQSESTAPRLTRSQTQQYEEEDDDMLGEMPNVTKPTTTSVFDGSKSSSTAESLVDFMEKFTWAKSQIKDIPEILQHPSA